MFELCDLVVEAKVRKIDIRIEKEADKWVFVVTAEREHTAGGMDIRVRDRCLDTAIATTTKMIVALPLPGKAPARTLVDDRHVLYETEEVGT